MEDPSPVVLVAMVSVGAVIGVTTAWISNRTYRKRFKDVHDDISFLYHRDSALTNGWVKFYDDVEACRRLAGGLYKEVQGLKQHQAELRRQQDDDAKEINRWIDAIGRELDEIREHVGLEKIDGLEREWHGHGE